MRSSGIAFVAMLQLLVGVWPASAFNLRYVEGALPPFGHTVFCLNYPTECERSARSELWDYSRLRYDELDDINRRINTRIVPERQHSDRVYDTLWRVNPSSGDCNDYAVTKRHELLRKGWPSSSLLLAEVVLKTGQHHLVLIARMNGIEFVLDNLNYQLTPLDVARTEYRLTKVSSEHNPRFWMLAESF